MSDQISIFIVTKLRKKCFRFYLFQVSSLLVLCFLPQSSLRFFAKFAKLCVLRVCKNKLYQKNFASFAVKKISTINNHIATLNLKSEIKTTPNKKPQILKKELRFLGIKNGWLIALLFFFYNDMSLI